MYYGKITSPPVPLIFGLACESAFTSCHACAMLLCSIECDLSPFKPPQICLTQTISGIDGDTIDGDSMVDFRWVEWTKGYLVQAILPHWEKKTTSIDTL